MNDQDAEDRPGPETADARRPFLPPGHGRYQLVVPHSMEGSVAAPDPHQAHPEKPDFSLADTQAQPSAADNGGLDGTGLE